MRERWFLITIIQNIVCINPHPVLLFAIVSPSFFLFLERLPIVLGRSVCNERVKLFLFDYSEFLGFLVSGVCVGGVVLPLELFLWKGNLIILTVNYLCDLDFIIIINGWKISLIRLIRFWLFNEKIILPLSLHWLGLWDMVTNARHTYVAEITWLELPFLCKLLAWVIFHGYKRVGIWFLLIAYIFIGSWICTFCFRHLAYVVEWLMSLLLLVYLFALLVHSAKECLYIHAVLVVIWKKLFMTFLLLLLLEVVLMVISIVDFLSHLLLLSRIIDIPGVR